MKKPIIPALALIILQDTASAAPGTATGPTAVALAAVLAQHSPGSARFRQASHRAYFAAGNAMQGKN